MDVGDVARLTVEIRVDNQLVDPDELFLVVRPPTGERYMLDSFLDDLERLGTGKYRAKVPCTETGRWRFQWVAIGDTAPGVETGSFEVVNGAL